MGRKKPPRREIKEHWGRLRDLNCLISEDPVCVIAHCHGGSISETLGYNWRPGWSQRQNHWLTIPLAPKYHNGQWGLDTWKDGVYDWELFFYSQIELLERVSFRLGYDVFELAGVENYEYSTRDPFADTSQ
jgi:hypothetical protein